MAKDGDIATVAVAVLAVYALSLCNPASAAACDNADAKVLILGAGMAGVTAAYSLQQNGTSDFIILEAQDRMGGRMRTDMFAGIRVNVGATWMQGVDPEDPSR